MRTVACDPTISVLGLSRRLWGWSGLERARSGPCIAGAVVHAVRHQSGMRCTACVETHRHRDSVSDFPLLNAWSRARARMWSYPGVSVRVRMQVEFEVFQLATWPGVCLMCSLVLPPCKELNGRLQGWEPCNYIKGDVECHPVQDAPRAPSWRRAAAARLARARAEPQAARGPWVGVGRLGGWG